MAKTTKKAKKFVIFDFTEYYNKIKNQEVADRALAAEIAAKINKNEKQSLWTRIKNWFKNLF